VSFIQKETFSIFTIKNLTWLDFLFKAADYEPPSKRKSFHAQDSAKNNGKKTLKR
jgi:hypothetical protein